MATYVMSDIHGEYEQYMKLMERIRFSADDTLYVLGDVLDRGPHPIKVLLEMMKYPNIRGIAGNHEAMGITCLRFLQREITERNIARLNERVIDELLTWQLNGGMTTTDEFHGLDKVTQERVLKYIEDFSLYEELTVNKESYILVHAGLGNFTPERLMCEYELHELVWERSDYGKEYFDDCTLITGHTPTQDILENPDPGYIYRANHQIAIDCGACFGGRLAALCLETGEEFYARA